MNTHRFSFRSFPGSLSVLLLAICGLLAGGADAQEEIKKGAEKGAGAIDLPKLTKAARPSVVLVEVLDKYGRALSIGTGFYIRAGEVSRPNSGSAVQDNSMKELRYEDYAEPFGFVPDTAQPESVESAPYASLPAFDSLVDDIPAPQVPPVLAPVPTMPPASKEIVLPKDAKPPNALFSKAIIKTRPRGMLMTNRHVISSPNCGMIRVRAHDGAETMIGWVSSIPGESGPDLALLWIEDDEWCKAHLGAPLEFAHPAKAEAGERVAVIGSPLGLEGSLSEGIISSVRTETNKPTMLQITAAISPGSSGSPVFNEAGKVLGIATLFWQGGTSTEFCPFLGRDEATGHGAEVRFAMEISGRIEPGFRQFMAV